MGLADWFEIPASPGAVRLTRALVVAGVCSAALATGCGPQGHYFRGDAGSTGGRADGATVDTPVATGGVSGGGSGGGIPIGTGGSVPSTGGAPGTGGAGTGGRGTGGMATGGTVAATGGAGTGGAGTGGAGTGGMGTGGAATGGAASGGMGTGGAGTGGAAGAPPRILSVDFVGAMTNAAGATGVMPTPTMAPTESAGYKPAINWNAAVGPMGNATGLKLTDGTVTTATVTWNSPPMAANPGVWWNQFPDAAGDVRMMNGYLDPSATASPAVVTVAGLPSSITTGGYDVYVYTVGQISDANPRVYSYVIGATTVMVTAGRSSATFGGYVLVPAGGGTGNTVVFRNVTGTSFTLTARPVSGTQRAPVNGLQIVSPRGS